MLLLLADQLDEPPRRLRENVEASDLTVDLKAFTGELCTGDSLVPQAIKLDQLAQTDRQFSGVKTARFTSAKSVLNVCSDNRIGPQASLCDPAILCPESRRFVKLVGQQEQHRLTHLAVELSEKTAEAVQRRVAAAISPESERDRAAVALERARIADAHAEHALVAARYELAASWGAIQPDFVEAAADLYALPELSAYEDLLAALERTPDLSRYLSERRLRESEVTLALASQRPGIEIGAGIRRLAEIDDTAFVFNVGIPLTVNNRNQGAVAEAEALKAGAQANRSAALLKARTQLFSNHRELQDLGQQVRALRERALPRTEAALKGTESAYERGRYSYLELVDAQRELLSVRDNLIEAAMQYHLTLIEIERLTATAVSR